MRAAVLESAGTPISVYDDVEIRSPEAGEVLVRIAACGVCHSDLSAANGSFPTVLPVILGHEAAGIVEAVGAGIETVSEGDKVVLTPAPSCGTCYWCSRGEFSVCRNIDNLFSGTMSDGTTPYSRGGQPVYRGLATGAWGEYAMMQQEAVVKVADDTPLDVACVLGCAMQTGVGAVLNTAKVEEGATALVMGAGGIGIAVTQGLRLANASRIVVSDPNPDRREMATKFGATDVIDPADTDPTAFGMLMTGGIGFDYAFEAAGVAKLLEDGINAVRRGGTIVGVGAPPIEQGISIPMVAAFTAMEKKLIGCMLGSVHAHRDIPRMLDLWRGGKLDLDGMITARRPLDEVNEAFADMDAGRGLRTVLTIS